ncbi:MAG: Crp/Fnr family transcriptional regulator [Thermaerobacter sp.]|nr:Crp/Fnr family transcriptional regulator [Thermaerobacter sp.]
MPAVNQPNPLLALRQLPPFAALPDTTIAALGEVTSMRHYRRDMFIFAEGEPAEMFCFVHSGAVKVFKTTVEGQEQTLHFLRSGELFAVTGFIVPAPYPGTAQTLEDSWIGCVRNQALRALASRDVDIAFALLEHFGQRLTGTSRHVLDLGTRDAAGKLAAALLELVGANEEVQGALTVDLHLTHKDLAQLIGASRETVTRLLGDFREADAVATRANGGLTVYPKNLRRYVE